MDEEWSDFLQFVADVGERPSPKHKLFVADDSKPIGPTNFVWKRAITERAPGENERTYQARAQRVYRRVREEAFKGYYLKKLYGLSLEQYDEMHDRQQGRCAICRSREASTIRGRRASLAVDHCHAGGHVRELLCSKCNTGLGSFRDDPALLRVAADYLERHQLPVASE